MDHGAGEVSQSGSKDQIRRTETGLAVLIMWLSTATARAASPC
jgi:hypothetical protein